MKLQWPIQSIHTQLVLSQVDYLNYRNKHIWPPTSKWLQVLEAFHLASAQIITFDHFWTLHLILRSVLEIFYISILRVRLWLFKHHTFQFKMSFSLFPSQILVYAMNSGAHNLFFYFEIYIWWALMQKHKNKGGKRYRHKSMQVSRPLRLLTNHTWQAWRSIYNNHT